MDFDEKVCIAADLRLAEALCRGAQNHIGDDAIEQARTAAEHAAREIQSAIGALNKSEGKSAVRAVAERTAIADQVVDHIKSGGERVLRRCAIEPDSLRPTVDCLIQVLAELGYDIQRVLAPTAAG